MNLKPPKPSSTIEMLLECLALALRIALKFFL